jgi:hypothetical protein
MVRVALSRITLKPEQLAALGSVVAESTYLESLVDSMIGYLAKLTDKQRNILLNKAMLNAKLEILAELGAMRLKSTRRKKVFSKIISELKSNNSERIIAVHGVWTPVLTRPAPTAPTRLADLLAPMGEAEATHSRGSKMTAGNLDKLAEKISKGFWDLSEFNSKVWIRQSVKRKMVKALLKSRGLQSPP